jgi:hypothetical protein
MGKTMSMKKTMIDERIESFCQASTELITNIHERCNNPESKSKRGRKKKMIEVEVEEELEVEDWDKELV